MLIERPQKRLLLPIPSIFRTSRVILADAPFVVRNAPAFWRICGAYSVASCIKGQVFNVMFENPSIPSAGTFPTTPYKQRVPFVATVGIDPSVPPYPISPLNVGQLNLTAADARFYPSAVKPTIYAEFKALRGAQLVNRGYLAAAATGRFGELRNNRLHLDPDPTSTSRSAAEQNPLRPSDTVVVDPALLSRNAR